MTTGARSASLRRCDASRWRLLWVSSERTRRNRERGNASQAYGRGPQLSGERHVGRVSSVSGAEARRTEGLGLNPGKASRKISQDGLRCIGVTWVWFLP